MRKTYIPVLLFNPVGKKVPDFYWKVYTIYNLNLTHRITAQLLNTGPQSHLQQQPIQYAASVSSASGNVCVAESNRLKYVCWCGFWLIDWVSEFRFTAHSKQNRFPKPISWHGKEKLNLTQQKHTFTNPKKCSTTQNKNKKKLKPGLVASYDIWPGTGESLFWFWHFINLSLTYLLT